MPTRFSTLVDDECPLLFVEHAARTRREHATVAAVHHDEMDTTAEMTAVAERIPAGDWCELLGFQRPSTQHTAGVVGLEELRV